MLRLECQYCFHGIDHPQRGYATGYEASLILVFTTHGFIQSFSTIAIPASSRSSLGPPPLAAFLARLKDRSHRVGRLQFRINILKEDVIDVIASILGRLDYTGFKKECEEDEEYHWTLVQTWGLLNELRSATSCGRGPMASDGNLTIHLVRTGEDYLNKPSYWFGRSSNDIWSFEPVTMPCGLLQLVRESGLEDDMLEIGLSITISIDLTMRDPSRPILCLN